MRDNIELFQGSNVVLERPEVLISGVYKDFGYGFYCTNIKKQAKRWVLTKRPKHIINKYIYSENKELQILKFEQMIAEWLDFIVSCRRGISHTYDIVEGPMADDTIRNYIEDFVDGTITREAFWMLVKFKYPTHQIVFCNDNSLKSLKFEGAYSI